MTKKQIAALEPFTAWAWAIRGGSQANGRWMLCWWIAKTRRGLLSGERPSPEARAIKVTVTAAEKKARKGK